MIPAFTDSGVLPAGVYLATVEEVEARFGSETRIRRDQMESIRWTVELARKAGAARVVINGSFVTDVAEPNDVDCIVLFSPGGARDLGAAEELESGVPFVDLLVVSPVEFERFVSAFFAYDRFRAVKGMIEVML